jgi:hypothetical protein
MHFNEVENLILDILQNNNGRYLFPYQIFTRLQEIDPALGQRIRNEYPVQTGNNPMGEGAGIYYSPASFISHALNHLFTSQNYNELDKRWFDSNGLKIDGIVPGNKESTSIWAWNPRIEERCI